MPVEFKSIRPAFLCSEIELICNFRARYWAERNKQALNESEGIQMFNNIPKYGLLGTALIAGAIQALSPVAASAAATQGNGYVPFEFRVGKSILPAGKYELKRTTQGSNGY